MGLAVREEVDGFNIGGAVRMVGLVVGGFGDGGGVAGALQYPARIQPSN